MANEKGYRVEVTSSYAEFWRYNVALMCGCFDAEDNRTGFASSEDVVADMGASLTAAPEGYSSHRTVVLEVPDADHLVLYVYIIPHTLPVGNDIAVTKPFALRVRVLHGGNEVLRHDCHINQWSGASIEMKVSAVSRQ